MFHSSPLNIVRSSFLGDTTAWGAIGTRCNPHNAKRGRAWQMVRDGPAFRIAARPLTPMISSSANFSVWSSWSPSCFLERGNSVFLMILVRGDNHPMKLPMDR